MGPRRMVKSLHNMEIDEISLVDRPANQHAAVSISKRASEEETMPEFYNESGELLTDDDLVEGATVFDEDGEPYVLVQDDEAEFEQEKELATVGKRHSGSSFQELILEELSKADGDAERDAVLSKALSRVQELEQESTRAAEIAKSERDLRLTREYISKAAEYNVPVDPNELGPVLYRMAESLPYEDCAVIHKALSAAGDLIFEEIGVQGGGDNTDVLHMANAVADEFIGKSDDNVSKAHALSSVFDSNPEAYEAYLNERY